MAQVGEVRIIQHTETFLSASTIDANPKCNQTDPTGSAGDITATVAPGSAALVQTLSASWGPTVGGKYIMSWNFTTGGQTLKRKEVYFAYWTDVYSFVRQLTGLSVSALADYKIDREFSSLQREVTYSFGLSGYSSLSSSDQDDFDEGIALLVAIRLSGYTATVSPTGSIIKWKIEQDEIQFKPLAERSATDFDDWYGRAMRALGRVSGIAAVINLRNANTRIFNITGPTRVAKATRPETLFSVTARLLSDTYTSDAWVVLE